MAITKSQLLDAVNNALEREETDIDSQISRVLFKISNKANFLADIDSTKTIDPDNPTMDFPDYYKTMDNIKLIDSNGNFTNALSQLSYSEFLNSLTLRRSSVPNKYAIYNRQIYFSPLPISEYTVELSYFKIHPPTPDDILFDDRFLSVMESGSVYEVAFKFGLKEQISMWQQRYADDLNDIMGYQMNPIYTTEFRLF